MTDNAGEDLRATADDLAAETTRLKALEVEKAHLDPDDPRLVTVAEEATRLAARIALGTRVELDLARQAAEAGPDEDPS